LFFMALQMTNILKSASGISRVAWSGISDLLWPPLCVVCGESVVDASDGLCQACWDEIMACAGGDYCRRCGKDVSKYAVVDGKCGICSGTELAFDGIARAGVYQDALRGLIHGFKFNDRSELADLLGSMADSAFQGSEFFEDVDVFVPVPLHWIRRLRRGYNQANLLTKRLGHPSAGICTDLVRIRNTHRQWGLTASKRQKNVAGAFGVRRRHNFSGKRVCLVDDISTSWATLNECAKTLKLAGAEKVYAVVVSVAMQKR
jgi:competence protein ComFC